MQPQTVFFSDKALAERYQVTRQTIWRWVRENRLAKPVKLAAGSTRWTQAAVEKFEEAAK
ncbi:AlpA family transcriptional regulator [Halothiobacillus sp.]|uniref:helix-turn-helix transcriptional regulator n=1 Tax=Halothiobacillus sp. TaxID=1891311 RepID=UPI00260F0816|nr:AlpA family transcriptional regulator [Halothiobacillus sp.]